LIGPSAGCPYRAAQHTRCMRRYSNESYGPNFDLLLRRSSPFSHSYSESRLVKEGKFNASNEDLYNLYFCTIFCFLKAENWNEIYRVVHKYHPFRQQLSESIQHWNIFCPCDQSDIVCSIPLGQCTILAVSTMFTDSGLGILAYLSTQRYRRPKESVTEMLSSITGANLELSDGIWGLFPQT
jgi:hypothetical protein